MQSNLHFGHLPLGYFTHKIQPPNNSPAYNKFSPVSFDPAHKTRHFLGSSLALRITTGNTGSVSGLQTTRPHLTRFLLESLMRLMVLENITEECHQYNLDHHQVGVNEPINTVLQTILGLAVNFVPWFAVKTRLNTREG